MVHVFEKQCFIEAPTPRYMNMCLGVSMVVCLRSLFKDKWVYGMHMIVQTTNWRLHCYNRCVYVCQLASSNLDATPSF